MTPTPRTELDPRFSNAGATATPWAEGRRRLEEAAVYWISTVRRDGRPHVTPLYAVWLDDALHFCSGEAEQKSVNLAANPNVVMTTGCNNDDGGLDVVVEGTAERITEQATLERINERYIAKYGEEWRFEISDGVFHGGGGPAPVYRVQAGKALGFAKGAEFSHTRWVF
jgi:general stress protein 26